MTEEQINIAIAESCGYEWVSNGWGCRFLGSPTERSFGSDTQSPLCEDAYDSVPDYCKDLNAMHEAVCQVFTDSSMQLDYSRTLIFVVKKSSPICKRFFSDFDLATATANQRAEAFLRTIGKWEEAK